MVSQKQGHKNNEIDKTIADSTLKETEKIYWEKKLEEFKEKLDGKKWKEQVQFAFESGLKGKIKAEELPNDEDLRDKPKEVQDARYTLGRHLG